MPLPPHVFMSGIPSDLPDACPTAAIIYRFPVAPSATVQIGTQD
jgi:hypothetical protein